MKPGEGNGRLNLNRVLKIELNLLHKPQDSKVSPSFWDNTLWTLQWATEILLGIKDFFLQLQQIEFICQPPLGITLARETFPKLIPSSWGNLCLMAGHREVNAWLLTLPEDKSAGSSHLQNFLQELSSLLGIHCMLKKEVGRGGVEKKEEEGKNFKK